MKSVMVHQFSQIPRANIPRSSFKRSHAYKTTFDAGYLIPFYVDEALPGDTFKCHAELFARLATPIVPVMDNMYLDVFFFAVPNRLVWKNWQRFCGERNGPNDVYEGVVPVIQPSASSGFSVGSLSDYFGIPVNVSGLKVNALWHRAYNLIWNEWFRSELLQDMAVVDTDDAVTNDANYPLRRRGKRFDYFTSCLPTPQKGPEATISLGNGVLDVVGDGNALGLMSSDVTAGTGFLAGGSALTAWKSAYGAAIGSNNSTGSSNQMSGSAGQTIGVTTEKGKSGMVVPLDNVAATSINDLRRAVALQQFAERQNFGGSRYTEVVRSHFNVISPDARLQRPEYLGGGSIPVNINQVPQTSSSNDVTPQGNLAAYGFASGNCGFVKSFTEHTLLIGLLSVRADLTYQQGVDRMFSRQILEDFYWPTFNGIGEQAVFEKEIYATGVEDQDNAVFGYQERYGEYRYKPSKITGKLRSGLSDSLDVWHLSQFFTESPRLNAAFIADNPPVDRVIAVQDEPQFILDSFLDLDCARPMPVYSVPGLNRL